MSDRPIVPIVGQKGVQYGLQRIAPKKPSAVAPAAPKPLNVFGHDSDEEDVEKQIARQADKKRAAAKVQQMYEQALEVDPTVFDYDGVYDSIQETRVQPKQQDKLQRHSKYIAQLLDQAQRRKVEAEVLYERKMVKERQQEDHLYEDKERFVTSAYRKKLEEDKKWQEQEKLRELEEQRNDVRNVGHMGNFYANLLTKNVAFGTATAPAAPAPAVQDEQGAQDQGAGPTSRETSPSAGQTAEPSAKVLAQLDKYDLLRLEAEKALRERRRREQEDMGRAGDSAGATGPTTDDGGGPSVDGQEGGGAAAPVTGSHAAPGSSAGQQEAPPAEAAAEAAAVVPVKRRNDDTSVQSARDRYLARKQQRTG